MCVCNYLCINCKYVCKYVLYLCTNEVPTDDLISLVDSSFDYKDSSGIDLHEFIVKTLRENPR